MVKKDIIKNISAKAHLDLIDSSYIFEKFIFFIKEKKNVKISNFGAFTIHTSKPRIGRNPLTKEIYPIPIIKKISFKASTKVKKIFN